MIEALTSPFSDYAFMRRALAAGCILALGATPLGVFMNLRRMTLLGDALSHAILPGVAAGFLAFGLSLWPLSLGGLLAGLLMAVAAQLLIRMTMLKEDAAFTLLYLLSLAGGVTLIAWRGKAVDLLHLLFGNILAIDKPSLCLVLGVAWLSLFAISVLYRRLVIDSFDPAFMRAAMAGGRRRGGWTSLVFFCLLVLNLVAAFQALGTLMALGLVILPGLAARFWAQTLDGILPLSMLLGCVSVGAGLLLSFYGGAIPAGPAVVLVCGALALLSACLGRYGSVRVYLRRA